MSFFMPKLSSLVLGIGLAVMSLTAYSQTVTDIPHANKLAYDAYNAATSTVAAVYVPVTVTGVCTVAPVVTQYTPTGTVGPYTFTRQQDGQYQYSFIIQDAAVRTIAGTTYSNAIRVFTVSTNYPTISNTTTITRTYLNSLHVPTQGDVVTVTGFAKLDFVNSSAIFTNSIGNEPIIDLSIKSGAAFVYPFATSVTIASTPGTLPSPLSITPNTLSTAPFSNFPGTAMSGLLGLYSNKGAKGVSQGNIVPNPLANMLVSITGIRYAMGEHNSVQQSFNSQKVGFYVADSAVDGKAVYVKVRTDTGSKTYTSGSSTLTSTEPAPIDVSSLFVGDTGPIVGTVHTYRTLMGENVYNFAGIFAYRLSDIGSSSIINSVDSTTITPGNTTGSGPNGAAPIPGNQVTIEVNTNNTNTGDTVFADLSALGDVKDLNGNPIPGNLLPLPVISSGVSSTNYKGAFTLGTNATVGNTPVKIIYTSGSVVHTYDSDSGFEKVLLAKIYKTLGALKLDSFSKVDGFPVAMDDSVAGTILPVVTIQEDEPPSILGTATQMWVEDPTGVAGIQLFDSQGNNNNLKAVRGNRGKFYGTLGTFSGANREVVLPTHSAYTNVSTNVDPLPLPKLVNTADVSGEAYDFTFNHITTKSSGAALKINPPANQASTLGMRVTVVGKVVNKPSLIADFSTTGEYIDVDDGTGLVVVRFSQTVNPTTTLKSFDLTTEPVAGDTVIVTGVASSNTTSSSNTQGSKIFASLWALGPLYVIKNPTPTTVTIPVSAGQNLLSLTAVPAGGLLGDPTVIFPSSLGVQKKYGANYVNAGTAPATGQPWYSGFKTVRIGEAYKTNGTAGTISYSAVTSGTGVSMGATNVPPNTSAPFNLDTNNDRYVALYDTVGNSTLIGNEFTNSGKLYAPGSSTADFIFSEGGYAYTSPAGILGTATYLNGSPVPTTVLAPGKGMAVTPGETGTFVLERATSSTQYSLSGQISITGYVGDISLVPFTITLLSPGTNNVLYTYTVNTNSSGAYTIPYVIPGTYDIRAKGFTTLSKLNTNVNLTSNATGVDFLNLIPGDSNNDNVIDDTDLLSVINNFLSTTFPNADFNGDGIVDDTDLLDDINNFLATGS